MPMPAEPIGSIPRPLELIKAVTAWGDDADPRLQPLYEAAIVRKGSPTREGTVLAAKKPGVA